AAGPGAAGPAGPVAVGDEVIAFRAPGAYTTELVAPASALVPRPAALDWAQAASLMLTGVTAWHLLAATDVHEGDTVLIHGGAGGVGLMAVQLTTGRGATAVVTARPAGHGFLRDLGALPVAYGPRSAGPPTRTVPSWAVTPPERSPSSRSPAPLWPCAPFAGREQGLPHRLIRWAPCYRRGRGTGGSRGGRLRPARLRDRAGARGA